ncbi:MAG: 3'-5' exonuclease [Verrucomicrobiota bacterium]|nr:3'-5' exonuclease [Verrucomicrobiota bacterium]
MKEQPLLKLKLDRPLAFFDIESTGASPRADRIIDLTIIKLMPDGARSTHNYRVNPGMPIPPEATRIHGIADADVAGCPRFADVAAEAFQVLDGADLGGYNILRFDIPLLTEEFLRAGLRFTPDGRRIIDAQRIFHRREPRDLAAALAFYCGELHLGAHRAEADVLATIRVLQGQFDRYADLPRDLAELDKYCDPRDPSWVDRTGRLRWKGGEIALNFGRKKGAPLREIIAKDPDFVKWMLRSDFSPDFRKIVVEATQGKWPAPPSSAPPPENGE